MTLNPRFVGNLRFLAASLAASGQFKEAREVGRACVQGCRQARLFGEHLVLAGLPE